MRLKCEVLINYRHLSLTPNQQQKRPTHSSLALGKFGGSSTYHDELCLHLCNMQNPKGNKYKIQKNILAIFSKFIEEGKFTIRLKEPAIDIIIKCEANIGKKFLKILSCAINNKEINDLPLTAVNSLKRKQLEKPKTKMHVFRKEDYPIKKSFPSTLKELQITGIQVTRIDLRILSLKYLESLNLSDNNIKEIPSELSEINSLISLDLSKNNIENISTSFFIKGRKLYHLDLSHNKISLIPREIDKLTKLGSLLLQNNCITELPFSFSRLINLRTLSLYKNNLQHLPMNFNNLRLDSLDISGNPFITNVKIKCFGKANAVPYLKEISGSACVTYRLDYTYPKVPATIVEYLDYHFVCKCGKPLFGSLAIACDHVSIHAASLITDHSYVPQLGYYCFKCFKSFRNIY